MQTITSADELRQCVAQWRKQGLGVALVPTMGNLHAGHATLVAQARLRADRIVVSVFVNPLQFGPTEDFSRYPRTPIEDQSLLNQCGADVLFMPAVEQMYPHGMSNHTTVTVPSVSDILCGAFRPGHFTGVATVVAKLFNLVMADVAIFGEKDFQQLHIIRRMVADLCLPLKIVGIPTVREPDGLAMSSRNRYLNTEQRQLAPAIYTTLVDISAAIQDGDRSFTTLEMRGLRQLEGKGFAVDYIAIRDALTLELPAPTCKELVVLVAARIGKARLIDNMRVDTG